MGDGLRPTALSRCRWTWIGSGVRPGVACGAPSHMPGHARRTDAGQDGDWPVARRWRRQPPRHPQVVGGERTVVERVRSGPWDPTTARPRCRRSGVGRTGGVWRLKPGRSGRTARTARVGLGELTEGMGERLASRGERFVTAHAPDLSANGRQQSTVYVSVAAFSNGHCPAELPSSGRVESGPARPGGSASRQ